MPYPALVDETEPFLLDMVMNVSISILKDMVSPHPVQAIKCASDISSQYLLVPFDERIWYLSNASLSFDWRKNSSTGHRSTYLSRISRVLRDISVLMKARRGFGKMECIFWITD